MMPTPQYSLSAKDRLWQVLQSHEGKWEKVEDLMFDAGFVPTARDRLTAFTSFYSNLCRLKDAAPDAGYDIFHQGNCVMLRARVAA